MHFLFETFNFFNGFHATFLYIITLISILSGILIVITKNPIVSVLYLILLFSNISCYLIFIGIVFIGLSYLLVYVGAVSILFLFILMLINVRVSELLNETSNSIPLVFIIAFSLNSILSKLLPENIYSLINNKISFNNYSDYLNKLHIYNNEDKISFVTVNTWDNNLAEINHITSIGNIIYTNYSIWLILTSIILLLAMVGAIVITIKQKNS